MSPSTLTVLTSLATLVSFVAVYVFASRKSGDKVGLNWRSTRATSVSAGPFTVRIPAGWRDASEATDDFMTRRVWQHAGATLLVKERFVDETIIIKATALAEVGGKPGCEDIVAFLAAQDNTSSSDVKATTFAGDPGCVWTANDARASIRYHLRVHGNDVLLVGCQPTSSQAVCRALIRGAAVK